MDGKCGFAIPTGDYEGLWDKVLEIKEKRKKKYSSLCIEWVSSHFEMKENYERYIELYNLISKE